MLRIMAHNYQKYKSVGAQLIYFYSTSVYYLWYDKANGKLKPKFFEYCEGWKALYGDIDPFTQIVFFFPLCWRKVQIVILSTMYS